MCRAVWHFSSSQEIEAWEGVFFYFMRCLVLILCTCGYICFYIDNPLSDKNRKKCRENQVFFFILLASLNQIIHNISAKSGQIFIELSWQLPEGILGWSNIVNRLNHQSIQSRTINILQVWLWRWHNYILLTIKMKKTDSY